MGRVIPSVRPTRLAHDAVAAALRPGALAIDATAGNGYDTVFLADGVGDGGRVLAFDVQAEAIAAARARVEGAGLAGRVEFIHGSHALIPQHAAPESAAAVMFNLGYFPGGDHAVITLTGETLVALEGALRVLAPGGVLTVVCYPGHPGGDEEAEAVVAWAGSRAKSPVTCEVARRIGTERPAPFLVVLRKRPGRATG